MLLKSATLLAAICSLACAVVSSLDFASVLLDLRERPVVLPMLTLLRWPTGILQELALALFLFVLFARQRRA